jgi:hypothetical protein
VSGNSGAWGIVLWKDGRELAQLDGISLEGGDPVVEFLPTAPLGCLTLPPEGMGVPPVRSGDVTFAQRDGVVQFGDYYQPRILTFRVSVCNDMCPGCSSTEQVDGALFLDGVSNGRALTPDSPGLEITGDLDVRIHLAMDDWTPAAATAPISQWLTVGVDERGWTTRVNTTGTTALFWSEDGTNATVQSATSTGVLPALADGEELWLRYSLDIDNGAGGRDIRFWTSTDGSLFTQLGGTVTQAGVTSIHDSSADVIVGSYNNGGSEMLAGRVFSAEIRDGAMVVADPNFVQPAGTTSFVDGAGNTWSVVSPAFLVPFSAAARSARQKMKRLTEEWSRNCAGATLAILSDCHSPTATQEEKTYQGPYLVHGRPRVAEITWLRSNIGCGQVLLRFDCEDAALRLAVNNDPGPGAFPWNSDHTEDVEAGGGGGNMHPNYRLDGLTMTTNGGTFNDFYSSSGGPDGGSYFSRNTIVANTTSPMTMDTTPSGTGAIPVVAGTSYTASWWAEKNVVGGPQTRVIMRWFDAGGATISTIQGTNMTALTDWSRHSETFVAPVGAAFLMPILAWSGTALDGQALHFAQIWINEGAVATGPAQIEVVGDLCVFPGITLNGELTAPITVNYGENEFTYDEDVSAVESVNIDTRWGRANTITVDTSQHLSGNYTSPLGPGLHDFSITTADPTDTGDARIQWYNAVISG